MLKWRDPYFDLVKAIAISMVIFCHVMCIAPDGTFPVWINNFRVGMNMPIFFMLSGYFAWPMIEAHDWCKLRRNIRSYLQPALFAGVLYTLVGLVIGLVNPSPCTIVIRLLRSVFVDPWFITTLIECQLLLFLSYVFGHRIRWSLLIVFVVLLLIMSRPSFIPGNIHWGCLINMMPHFAFGAIVMRKFGFRLWEHRKLGLLCFVAFVVFVLLEGNVESNGMSFYTSDSSIHALCSFKSRLCLFLRPIVGLIGSIGVMALLRVALDVAPSIRCVARIGTLTLGIYIFHLWPLGRLRSIAWVGSSRLSVVVTASMMLLIFSVGTWLLTEKTGRFKKWIWGK